MLIASISAETGRNAGEGEGIGESHETSKTMEKIIADHLEGNDGCAKVERWVPGWLALPPAAYTARGGVGSDGESSPGSRKRSFSVSGAAEHDVVTMRIADSRGRLSRFRLI